MEHPYSVKLTYKGAHRNWPKLAGDLYEKGVCIAKFWRGAPQRGFVPPIECKFYSEAARRRFDSFADSLSIGETIEALLP